MELNGYAVGDKASRLLKARKIEALLGNDLKGLRLLDLGAGSGLLSEYFHSRGALVTAADREPEIFAADFPVVTIVDQTLPFEDGSFDLVIFNHVIEHVGDLEDQARIIAEIKRVLAPEGRLYLAVPSKWALIEPHFRLPLLGALPRSWSNVMVRLAGKGQYYDCFPLSLGQLHRLLGGQFSAVRNYSDEAATWMMVHELRPAVAALTRRIPLWLLRPLFPTYIMICNK